MSRTHSPTVTSHLAQVSVQALTPQVVEHLVAAFRLELSSSMPSLLAPLAEQLRLLAPMAEQLRLLAPVAEEIRDLKKQSPLDEERGHDRECSEPAPVTALPGLPALDRATAADQPSNAPECTSVLKAGVDEQCQADGCQEAKAENEQRGSKLVFPDIDSLPMRMEIEMSTPLVDPNFPPPGENMLRWSWMQLSGRRNSNSAREGYHLTAGCDPNDNPVTRYSRFSFVNDSNGVGSSWDEPESNRASDRLSLSRNTINLKLKRAQATVRKSKTERHWVAKSVGLWLEDPESSSAAAHYNNFIIAFSIFSILVGLLPFVGYTIHYYFDVAIDALLCVETLLRVSVCPSMNAFVSNPANLIDCLSTLPLAAGFFMYTGILEEECGKAFLHSAGPVIRFLRFVRRFPTMQILMTAFRDCLEALPVLMYTLAVMGCIFTSAIFLVEPRDNIPSLSDSAWLVISTISTVGYGDVTPDTKVGAALASVLMVVGQLYMAMPFGIIGYNFTSIWEHRANILLLNSTRERLAKWGFGPYEIPNLFELFDLDESAEFDMQEFQLLFKEMDIGFSDKEIMELFKVIDKDCGGSIDEREFVKTVYPNEYRAMYGKAKKIDSNQANHIRNTMQTLREESK